MTTESRVLMKPENVRVGIHLGPIFYVVLGEQIDRFVAAIRSTSSHYSTDASPRVAPPTMRLQDYALLISSAFYGGKGGVHAKHRHEFFKPMVVGQTVKVTGSITRAEWKRGRFCFELEYETRDAESDDLLVRQAITSFLITDSTKERE